MVLFLITTGWHDVHFRSQWATIRDLAWRVPALVEAGFIGMTCETTGLLRLLYNETSFLPRARGHSVSHGQLKEATHASSLLASLLATARNHT